MSEYTLSWKSQPTNPKQVMLCFSKSSQKVYNKDLGGFFNNVSYEFCRLFYKLQEWDS